MRRSRCLAILLPVLGVLLLAGALRHPRSVRSSAGSLPEGVNDLGQAPLDPAAGRMVQQALAKMTDSSRQWLQTTVWVRSHVPDLSYQAQGSYYRAPAERFRLELRTRREKGDGTVASETTVLHLCDGRQRWHATRIGTGNWRDLSRVELEEGEGTTPMGMLPGPEALLRSLGASLSWVRQMTEGEDVIVLGTWPETVRESLAPRDRPWPAHLARVCRLVLRGKESWPARVEWWGPVDPGGKERLLLEMEFRDPVWGNKVPEDQMTRLFTLF